MQKRLTGCVTVLLALALVLLGSALFSIGRAQAQLANAPWPMFRHDLQHTGRSTYAGPETPDLRWSCTTGGGIISSPATGSGGTIYVGSWDNKLYAINPDGTIYVGSWDNKLYAINPDGTIKWSYTTGGDVESSPAIGSDGTIYVGSDDNKLYALNPTGTIKWSYTTGGAIDYSSPAIDSDGTIYVGSDDEKLYAIGEPSLEGLLDQIQAEVSVIRGLSPLREVDRQFIATDELREQVLQDLETDPEGINITQELLVFLGLMEEGQNLHNILLELHSEQIAGQYDQESEVIYVMGEEDALGLIEEVTFAHEYTHALQDQHFDLGLLLTVEDDSELYKAVECLVEGDATLVQYAYIWSVLDEAEQEALFREIEESEGSGESAFEAAPRIIQENMLFPYVAGLDFVFSLFEAGGWEAVNQAYGDPPRSTEQILHPEKYLEGDDPQSVTVPDLESSLGMGWSELDSDSMGELDMRLYLETFLDTDEATMAAEGWDGDCFVLLKDTGGRHLFVLNSVWDTVSDAREFFNAYTTFIETRSGGTWNLQVNEERERWWNTEGMSVYLGQDSGKVLIIIAPDEAIAGQVLEEFAQARAGMTIWGWLVVAGFVVFLIVAYRVDRSFARK